MAHPETPSSPILDYVDLLIRLGAWADAEKTLLLYSGKISPPEALEKRLSHVREKRKIYREAEKEAPPSSYIGEDDVVELVKGPVSIAYHLKDHGLNVEGVYRSLLAIIADVSEKLHYQPAQVRVRLHGDGSFLWEGGDSPGLAAQAWQDGSFDGAIHVRAHNLHSPEPQRLGLLVAHEYVHQVVADLSTKSCPCWLDEGLAVLLSQGLPAFYLDALVQAARGDSLLPLLALEEASLFSEIQETARLAYAQATSVTSWLVGKVGWGGVRLLLNKMARMAPESALKEFSLNYYLVEKDWQRWLTSQSGTE